VHRFKSKSELIFTIVYNKLKNDLRLPLASSVKELESILQTDYKTDKSRYFYEPGLNPDRKIRQKNDGLASNWRCGWRPSTLTSCWTCGLGAATETETKQVLTRTRTNKVKKAVLVSVWLKESY
jgi:hypothetical protein